MSYQKCFALNLLLWCATAHATIGIDSGGGSLPRIAFHILWDGADSDALTALLSALADPPSAVASATTSISGVEHTYLLDAWGGSEHVSALSKAASAVLPRGSFRVRSVDRPVPRGVSEALGLLDGMGELLWWGRRFDYYLPVWGGGGGGEVSPGSTAGLARALDSLQGASKVSVRAADRDAVDKVHLDAAVVFSRNAEARAELIDTQSSTPDRYYRRITLKSTDRQLALTHSFVRYATDDPAPTRLLCLLVHAADVVEHFFGTLAVQAGLPINSTDIPQLRALNFQ